jgi:hypothetical protein
MAKGKRSLKKFEQDQMENLGPFDGRSVATGDISANGVSGVIDVQVPIRKRYVEAEGKKYRRNVAPSIE